MNAPAWHILVVDDEPNIRKLLAGVLEDEGYAVTGAGNAAQADAALAAGGIDLVLLDVQLPGVDGLRILERWQKEETNVPVIMMSGHGTIRTAVQATRLGALDFIEKPIQAERLLLSIANSLQLGRLRNENRSLRRDLALTSEIIGNSPGIQELRDTIGRAAATDARVLITGESGTGKELVARALHGGSARRERAFIKINCAAIPSELLESELFGHERGAFTGAVSRRRGKFELAQKGTLLLDEIGDMNPTTQAKLLRVLEEQEMTRVGGEQVIKLNVRIIASTNRKLDALLAEGGFREDLFHRLNVIPIHVLPLRERTGDIIILSEYFFSHFSRSGGRGPTKLTVAAQDILNTYSWPGNVRELRNLCERLVIMTGEETVDVRHVEPLIPVNVNIPGSTGAEPVPGAQLAGQVEEFERRIIAASLARNQGNIAGAARELGLDRANLHRKLKRLGLKS
ncbi:MAG: sigma-54 dependent transcriptional regulator [Candidatus Latescibacterota bacterium]